MYLYFASCSLLPWHQHDIVPLNQSGHTSPLHVMSHAVIFRSFKPGLVRHGWCHKIVFSRESRSAHGMNLLRTIDNLVREPSTPPIPCNQDQSYFRYHSWWFLLLSNARTMAWYMIKPISDTRNKMMRGKRRKLRRGRGLGRTEMSDSYSFLYSSWYITVGRKLKKRKQCYDPECAPIVIFMSQWWMPKKWRSGVKQCNLLL